MNTIKVYGASDDLVYLAGEEYPYGSDKPTYALFSDGTQVTVVYGDRGVWEVEIIEQGTAKATKMLGLPDDAPAKQQHGDDDAPPYSDVLLLTADQPITLVKHGKRKLQAPPPDGSMERAKKVIEYIESVDGGSFFIHELEPDTYNDFLDGLAKLLAGKPGKAAPSHQLTFVITGTLSQPREHFVALIEAAGHKVASSVTGSTSYVLAGDNPGDKLLEAERREKSVISEQELDTILSR